MNLRKYKENIIIRNIDNVSIYRNTAIDKWPSFIKYLEDQYNLTIPEKYIERKDEIHGKIIFRIGIAQHFDGVNFFGVGLLCG
jgi:hypothetical protein